MFDANYSIPGEPIIDLHTCTQARHAQDGFDFWHGRCVTYKKEVWALSSLCPPFPSLMSGPVPEDSIPSTPSPENNVSSSALGVNNLQTTPRDSIAQSANAPLVTETDNGSEKNLEENAVDQPEPRKSLFKRPIFLLAVAAAIVVIVLVVILPVYFTVIKTKNNTSKSGNPNGNSGNNNNTGGNNNPGTPKTPNGLISGGDGSTVTMENGTQFTYQNSFGGFCAQCSFSRLK